MREVSAQESEEVLDVQAALAQPFHVHFNLPGDVTAREHPRGPGEHVHFPALDVELYEPHVVQIDPDPADPGVQGRDRHLHRLSPGCHAFAEHTMAAGAFRALEAHGAVCRAERQLIGQGQAGKDQDRQPMRQGQNFGTQDPQSDRQRTGAGSDIERDDQDLDRDNQDTGQKGDINRGR